MQRLIQRSKKQTDTLYYEPQSQETDRYKPQSKQREIRGIVLGTLQYCTWEQLEPLFLTFFFVLYLDIATLYLGHCEQLFPTFFLDPLQPARCLKPQVQTFTCLESRLK